MRLILCVGALVGLVPATVVAAPADEIVVQVDVGRTEIERILAADNLDTYRLNPRVIADRMAAIPRGRAPEDFWRAYQRHVDAWQRLAEAMANPLQTDDAELAAGTDAINRTFDEVERIALRYGARMPQPVRGGTQLPPFTD